MEFILNNQAQFTVDIQKFQETQKEGEKPRECFRARLSEFIQHFS